MKIATVYDDNGRILMAIIDDGKNDSPRPIPDRRTHGGTFEVPSALEAASLEEICTMCLVDRDTNRLMTSRG
jgi:hypothetical protein